jgi:hypothetical protein
MLPCVSTTGWKNQGPYGLPGWRIPQNTYFSTLNAIGLIREEDGILKIYVGTFRREN